MLANIPKELLVFLLILIVVIAVVVIVGGTIWVMIKTIKSNSSEQRRIIILTLLSLFIAVVSWLLNFGWFRFIMTFMLIPFIHAIFFFITNFFTAKYIDRSSKVKKLNLFFIITYLVLYVFLPDGGDMGELYFFFGLIHNDALSYIAEFISGTAFLGHIIFFIMQIIEITKIKKYYDIYGVKDMTTLILIRHGESETNRQGVFAGQVNPDLENKGLKQAQLTAEYIADNYKVDKIYSSDLQRAYRTALCLADILNLEVITNENLREINAGKWEGMKFDDLVSAYAEEYNMWLKHIGNCVCTGGESVRQLSERIMGALTKIAEENEGKTVVVTTHGTPIRAAQSVVRNGSLDEMENIPWVSNASVTVFEYNNNMWKEVISGEDKHLAELKTVLPKNA